MSHLAVALIRPQLDCMRCEYVYGFYSWMCHGDQHLISVINFTADPQALHAALRFCLSCFAFPRKLSGWERGTVACLGDLFLSTQTFLRGSLAGFQSLAVCGTEAQVAMLCFVCLFPMANYVVTTSCRFSGSRHMRRSSTGGIATSSKRSKT